MNKNTKHTYTNHSKTNNKRSTSGAASSSSAAGATSTDQTYQAGYDNQFCGIASWLLTLSPLEFAALSTSLGLLLSLGLQMDEAQRLGVFLGNTAYTMITYSSQANFLQDKYESQQAAVEYEDLIKVINNLQSEVLKLKNQHERGKEEENKDSSKEQ